MSRVAELHQGLLQAGLPVVGVALVDATPPAKVRIDFAADATAEQRARAEAIAAGFDWRKRNARPLDALVRDVERLPPNDRQRLVDLVLAETLQSRPDFATRNGIALEGDEPEA
jgi:hypothetical protein